MKKDILKILEKYMKKEGLTNDLVNKRAAVRDLFTDAFHVAEKMGVTVKMYELITAAKDVYEIETKERKYNHNGRTK